MKKITVRINKKTGQLSLTTEGGCGEVVKNLERGLGLVAEEPPLTQSLVIEDQQQEIGES